MRKFKISVLLKLGFYCLFLSIGLDAGPKICASGNITYNKKY